MTPQNPREPKEIHINYLLTSIKIYFFISISYIGVRNVGKYYWLPFSAYLSFGNLTNEVENILSKIGSELRINFAS